MFFYYKYIMFLFDMTFHNQINAIMGSRIFKRLLTLVSNFLFVFHIKCNYAIHITMLNLLNYSLGFQSFV
jgi:hypothetical protein